MSQLNILKFKIGVCFIPGLFTQSDKWADTGSIILIVIQVLTYSKSSLSFRLLLTPPFGYTFQLTSIYYLAASIVKEINY